MQAQGYCDIPQLSYQEPYRRGVRDCRQDMGATVVRAHGLGRLAERLRTVLCNSRERYRFLGSEKKLERIAAVRGLFHVLLVELVCPLSRDLSWRDLLLNGP